MSESYNDKKILDARKKEIARTKPRPKRIHKNDASQMGFDGLPKLQKTIPDERTRHRAIVRRTEGGLL